MVSNSYLRTSEAQAESFATITDKQIEEAIQRHLDSAQGSAPSDNFLKKMKAITSSMGHTGAAAKKARQNMLAMIAKFGLPSVMFTITPEDAVNFRIRVMATKKTGERNPPDPNTTPVHDQHEYILECGGIRQVHPGLCAIEFENVIAITIQHLLGWDMNKRKNIKDLGIFGDLLAWCYAVEEQGRKTLHAHFLLYLMKWSVLLQGLGDEATRERFSEQLVEYASKVMSTYMHGEAIPSCVQQDCTSNVFEFCSKQDIRNLRTKLGTTSLGGKAIAKCTTCNTCMTSEDLVFSRLKEIFQTMTFTQEQRENETNAESDLSDKTKLTNAMELLLMREQLKKPSRMTSKGVFVMNVLRNLHRSKHANSCFKKGEECRMHVPCASCDETELKFSADTTDWFDWKGKEQSRQLFTLNSKQAHADAFVNIHSSHASKLFGCNTNVVTGVDGGSVMYMTCYISKNTQTEDNELFTNSAKHMIKKMRESLLQLEDESSNTNQEQGGEDNENNRVATVMKTLIGAMLLSTSAHICSAPMASFLVRNGGSRFHYSHDFAYVNLNHFETDGLNDLSVDSIEGTPFLTSSVANYLLRQEELEGTCLYDFLSQFTVSRRTKSSLEWIKDHPSKNHLGVQASKHIKVPVVNYRDFMNTSSFGNQPIDSFQLPEILEEEHHAMELYAKKANLLFHPFRSVQTDLTVAGSYVRSFQEALCSGIITEAHCEILANIQDCRNSLEAGRPCDSLESETSCPSAACGHGSYNENNAEETNHDDIDSAFEELVETMNELNDSGLQLRTSNNIYQFSSSIIRKCGSAKCGVQNIATPNLGERVGANVFETQSEEMDPDQQHPSGLDDDDFISRYSTFVTKKALYELAISRTERITMDDGHYEIKATGTLKNI